MIFGFFKRKAAKPAAGQKTEPEGKAVGKVTHYFSHCKAGVIKLDGELNVGDKILIKGHTTDIRQSIDSMQVDGKPVTNAKKGDEIGLLVKGKVRSHDIVYKIS
jgi:putative protease